MASPKAELLAIPIPGVDREKFGRRDVYLLATEDLDVLHYVLTDDPVQACRYAKKNFSDFDIVVFTDKPFEEAGCRITRDLPFWAGRVRIDVAIAEGECEWLKKLPNGVGRDLFFQGVGAFVQSQEEIVALNTNFVAEVSGTLESEPIDCEVKLLIRMDPPQIRATLAYGRGGNSKSFDLSIGQEPRYLVPLFEEAFDLSAVPRLEPTDAPGTSITNADLGALGHGIGSVMQTQSHRTGGVVRAENPGYDLKARVREFD